MYSNRIKTTIIQKCVGVSHHVLEVSLFINNTVIWPHVSHSVHHHMLLLTVGRLGSVQQLWSVGYIKSIEEPT